jgi:hypothetical protein
VLSNISHDKNVFSGPNFDIPPPPEGPVGLGHIIDDPSELVPLNRVDRQDIPEDEVYLSHKSGFKATRGRLQNGEFGVWAKVLGLTGFGGKARWKYEMSSDDIYTFQSLDTTFFNPKQKYVEKSMQVPAIKRFMEAARYKTPVYMITGLKVASGASLESSKTKNHGSMLTLEAHGTPIAIPAAMGSKAGVAKSKTESMSFASSSDFVIAFRLRKILYKKCNITHRAHNKGATMLDGDDDLGTVDRKYFEVLGVADEDATAEDFEDMEDMVTVFEKDDEDSMWVIPATKR